MSCCYSRSRAATFQHYNQVPNIESPIINYAIALKFIAAGIRDPDIFCQILANTTAEGMAVRLVMIMEPIVCPLWIVISTLVSV